MQKTRQIDIKVQEFFSDYRLLKIAKGSVLLTPEQSPEGIYFLLKGSVKQYDISEQGNIFVTNVFKPNTFFPLSWAINSEKNMWYFEAASDCEIHLAPADETLAFIRSNPEVMYSFLERLLSGALGQQRRMVHLMGGRAYSRVVYELVVQTRRFGSKEGSGWSVAITDSELAGYAGLSRETVSRELKKLNGKCLIKKSYGHILVYELGDLEKELGFTV